MAREELRGTASPTMSKGIGGDQKEERVGLLPWAKEFNFTLNPRQDLSKVLRQELRQQT